VITSTAIIRLESGEMTSDVSSAAKKSNHVDERLLLLVLAAIQCTIVLDFLIIMPLGPQYMRVFAVTSGQFGLIVSAYAISAGISGIAAGFLLAVFGMLAVDVADGHDVAVAEAIEELAICVTMPRNLRSR